MKVSSGLLAGVLLTLAIPVGAQTLGELAKKEQERRKAAPPAAKTYTNEDLKKIVLPPDPADASAKPADAKGDASKPGDPAAAKSGDAAKAADAAKPGDAKPEPAKDEAYWRQRISAAREELRRDQSFRDALQSRINGLSADFASRDDPYQRAQIADERQKALAELARVTTEIGDTTKLIGDIEEEARRAGVPPGWLR
jgi:type IV secretory pathway VirB10-like protein